MKSQISKLHHLFVAAGIAIFASLVGFAVVMNSSTSFDQASQSRTPANNVYYVSPNGHDAYAGTQDSPWRTIQYAANKVNPGDMVILLDGTYEESEIAFKRSGTADKVITVKAQNKWKAIISSISGCQPAISLYASYITLKDLRLTVSSSNSKCGSYTSSNVHIRAWPDYEGFHADGLHADNASRSEGIKSNQDFTVIENSQVAHSLELMGSLNSVIRKNLVTGAGQYGISIFAKGGVRNAQIYGNVVRNKSKNGQAIIIGGYSCDKCFFDETAKIEAYNSVAYNNIVINEGSGTMAGLMFQGAKDSAFFNNVVINGVISMTVGGHDVGFQAPTLNPTFKNNIIVCNGKSLISGFHGWENAGSLSIDYNNFHNCEDSLSQDHAISGDPMFINSASNWKLQAGSPAINSGTPVTFTDSNGNSLDISRDFKGVVRTTPWDLGVYNVAP